MGPRKLGTGRVAHGLKYDMCMGTWVLGMGQASVRAFASHHVHMGHASHHKHANDTCLMQ